MLKLFPDQKIAEYLAKGFQYGFDIGFRGSHTAGASRNLMSAYRYAKEIDTALGKEVTRGHTLGPYKIKPFSNLHISPIGAVPKKYDDSYRLIMELSSPRGTSVNEGINKEEFSVTYSSFDEALTMIYDLGSFLAKIDIKHAFRICPVRIQDFPLLGIKWRGYYYVDTRLPFGSRSSPYIFNCFADFLCWCIVYVCVIVNTLHYLDDFITAHASKTACQKNVNTILKLFSFLGVPVAPEKLEGPSTRLTYLGIEIDTIEQTIRLPADKLTDFKVLLSLFSTRHSCSKRELLQLIGKLSFAAKVVKPGRLFLRFLIDLSTTKANLHMTSSY